MSNSKTVLAFLGGLAAGAAIAILFSSDKGNKIKKNVSEKAKGLADKILSKAEEIIDEAEASVRAGSERN